MKCDLADCQNRADPNGGVRCVEHAVWTASLLRQFCEAVETAIVSEDGLEGDVGEALLRKVGYWPARPHQAI